MSREMKDSGIEWVGEIPSDWNYCKIKYIKSSDKNSFVDGPFGSNLKSEHFTDSGDVFVIESNFATTGRIDENQLKKITKEHFETIRRSEAKYGDIIIAKIGENYGRAEILPLLTKNAVVSGNSLKLTVNKERNNSKYICYLLNVLKDRDVFKLLVNSTGQPALSLGAINNISFYLPLIDEQSRIANYLDSRITLIDQTIENQRKVIEKLKEYKQSIINEAVTKGLNPNVQMKDSGIEWVGKIPTHWETRLGKYLLKKENRKIKEGDEVITCFRDGQVTLRKNRREEGFTFADKEIGYQGILNGDLVIHGMDGFAGAIGISDSEGKGSPVLSVCTTYGELKINYALYYLRMLATQNVFLALATGIRERSCDLRWNKIANLPFVLPDINEQKEICDYLDKKHKNIDYMINMKEKYIERLETYKKSLIYEYVTGKREVK